MKDSSDDGSCSTTTIISSSFKNNSDGSILKKDNRTRPEGDDGRCSKPFSKLVYGKKRKFHGNSHTKVKNVNVSVGSTKEKMSHDSRSHKKVVDIPRVFPKESIEGYRLIDMVILRDIIAKLKCPDCNSKQLLLFEDALKKKGLASSLSVKCCECEFVLNRYTSNVYQIQVNVIVVE